MTAFPKCVTESAEENRSEMVRVGVETTKQTNSFEIKAKTD